MFFTIGGHPAFRVPVLEETVQTDYKLLFKGNKELEYKLICLEKVQQTPPIAISFPWKNMENMMAAELQRICLTGML